MNRFGRFRRNPNKPRRLVMGIHPVPTLVTLGNLVCGFGAIVLAIRSFIAADSELRPDDCLYFSGLLIFAAMIFDAMDGKVARWTKSASKFGMEMDSLCDVVSFGVAPAILVYAMIHHESSYPLLDRFVIPMLMAYACFAAMRLARYNIESSDVHRDFFFGMPSPGAAGCAASLAILINTGHQSAIATFMGPGIQVHEQFPQFIVWRTMLHGILLIAFPFIMLLLGVLMMTRVHYPHVGDRLLRGRKSFMHIMILGLGIVLIVMYHEIMLAALFNGYMLFGLLNELRYQLFPSQRPAEWISAADASHPKDSVPAVSPPPDKDGETKTV